MAIGMTINYVRCSLDHGYIHHWLTLGPRVIHASLKPLAADPGFAGEPVEPATPDDDLVEFGEIKLQWQPFACREDHLVDLTQSCPAGRCLQGWAYSELWVSAETQGELTLTVTTQTEVWLNGALLGSYAPTDQPLGTFQINLTLAVGHNALLLRLTSPKDGVGPLAAAVHLKPRVGEVAVALPTRVVPLERRQQLERCFAAAYLKQDVFTRDDEIVVAWPSPTPPDRSASSGITLTLRVKRPDGRIYAETTRRVGAGSEVSLGPVYQFPAGPLQVQFMPELREYYERNMRVRRTLSLWSLGNCPYAEAPSDEYPQRRRDALVSAARLEADIFSELAKMALGWWSRVEWNTVRTAADRVREGLSGPGAARDLLGLAALLARHGNVERFPSNVRQTVEGALLEADYGVGRAPPGRADDVAFLANTAGILVGQCYPDRHLPRMALTGAQLRKTSEAQALKWMRACASRGFPGGVVDRTLETVLGSLAHLIDLAEDHTVWELANVLFDKTLFHLGMGTFKGVLGVGRGDATTAELLGGQFSASAAISRLMWGSGVFNNTTLGTVSVACMESYRLPVLLRRIAIDTPPQVESVEHHAPHQALPQVTSVMYRTPDFMLGALQDYQPGTAGSTAHIWQASLGPGATVFVTHPASMSLHDSWHPNFWRGNRVHPRVIQWRDALVALHILPADDWLGFTHAYFPRHAFDATILRDGWAFARKGNGYLAVTAAQGLTQVCDGPGAYRELRSKGRENVWVCQMGRAAQDGLFEEFQAHVLATPIRFDPRGVRWTTVRGDTLDIHWDSLPRRNGELLPLEPAGAIESTYCTAPFPIDVMDIQVENMIMRLDFREVTNNAEDQS